ncbi:hypothetical protein BDV26DRAFT_141707 [Aspergillus bertholletiae]|uniref:Uncharacterized protein n=1 Tax=Aspergillus bertholletiae TaxID=1226010 RepID=A0A5N7AR01_9EURO|nr:hypothetical protein BDV26DRAFT_141707 [Aspergillus bertholletiae]
MIGPRWGPVLNAAPETASFLPGRDWRSHGWIWTILFLLRTHVTLTAFRVPDQIIKRNVRLLCQSRTLRFWPRRSYHIGAPDCHHATLHLVCEASRREAEGTGHLS